VKSYAWGGVFLIADFFFLGVGIDTYSLISRNPTYRGEGGSFLGSEGDYRTFWAYGDVAD
jgi:hypothetical protein